MWRSALLILATAALGGAPVGAQTTSHRPMVLIAGGVAGQNNGGSDLGSPGLSAALGLEWATAQPTLGLRVEAQLFEYGRQSLAAVLGAQGSAEQVGVLAAVARWTPWERVPLSLLGGPGVLTTRVTGEPNRVATAGGVAGLAIPVMSRVSIEGQYLHSARRLGATHGVLAARVLLRI